VVNQSSYMTLWRERQSAISPPLIPWRTGALGASGAPNPVDGCFVLPIKRDYTSYWPELWLRRPPRGAQLTPLSPCSGWVDPAPIQFCGKELGEVIDDLAYLTPQDVADLLQVHARTVQRWALTDPSCPATRLGPKVIRFERQALERWLARKQPRAAQRAAQAPPTAA